MAGMEVGELFADRYEILERLGRGGMGMVYRVKDWKQDKTRALKTLLPQYAKNPQAVRRFVREVNAVRQVKHPCVVRIFEARKHEEILFYTMEYIEGKSLRGWLRDRKKQGRCIGFGSTVRVLSMLCSALEEAHKYTIHRDISPENVMVTSRGEVKLLDFGLAKLETVDGDLTRVGISLGKIQYGAPEQRADAKNVDLRADLYSLGVMFYEMLSGELPTSRQKLTNLVDDFPPQVDTFVEKAMNDDPDLRFQNARDFRKALMELYKEIDGGHIKTAGIQEEEPVLSASPSPVSVPASAQDGKVNFWKRFQSRIVDFMVQRRRTKR